MKHRAMPATIALVGTLGLLAGSGVVALTATVAGAQNYYIPLTGSNQTPSPGDPDGTGEAVVKVKVIKEGAGHNIRVCAVIKKVKNLALPATAAHIHEGAPGVAGPILLTLVPPSAKKPGRPGKSKFCGLIGTVKTPRYDCLVSRELPCYLDVHTTEFPAGAIRGQVEV